MKTKKMMAIVAAAVMAMGAMAGADPRRRPIRTKARSTS